MTAGGGAPCAIDLRPAQAAFLAAGYDGVDMGRLARALGLRPDVLAARYPTKYDVWYAALCAASEDLSRAVTERLTAAAPLDRVAQACRATIDFALDQPVSYRFLYMPRSERMGVPDAPAPGVVRVWTTLRRLARRCVAEGAVAPLPPDLIAHGLMAVVTGAVELQRNVHRIPWSRELTDHVIATHLRGLAAAAGAPPGRRQQ